MIELSSDIPRFPDLTPNKFLTLECLKSREYAFNLQTVSHLKGTTVRQAQQIPLAMARASVLSNICHMQNLMMCEGGGEENS